MKTFQITFNGYDPANPDTDHLIAWINGRSKEVVCEFLDNTYPEQYESVEEISYREGKSDGVDLVLTD